MKITNQNILYKYMVLTRLNNSFAIFLLLLPSYWSLAINNNGESLKSLLFFYFMFFCGAIVMRSFGCVVNDLVDIKIDRQVSRTKNRPLAIGDLIIKQAILLLFMLGILAITVLLIMNTFRHNMFAVILTLSSLIFVFIYPFSKRFFFSPQLILGLTFNWGILAADAWLNYSVSIYSVILYLTSIVWTVAYDTVYAYQDYHDDKKIGIYSTALLIGDNPHFIMHLLYFIFISLIFILGIILQLNLAFYLLLLFSYLFILRKINNIDYKSKKSCSQFFQSNVYFAILIWISFLISN